MDIGLNRSQIVRLAVSLLAAGTLGACAFPDRQVVHLPDPGVIRLQADAEGRMQAMPPDCALLLEPPHLPTWRGNRPATAWGCATYTNLARQVARPEDLEAPQPYAGQDPTTAATAVERYHQNEVTPLNETSTRSTSTRGER